MGDIVVESFFVQQSGYGWGKGGGQILIKYWAFSERDKARAVESLVVQILTAKHGHFLDKDDMPQGGYTETFDASKITRKGLIRMVNKAIKG